MKLLSPCAGLPLVISGGEAGFSQLTNFLVQHVAPPPASWPWFSFHRPHVDASLPASKQMQVTSQTDAAGTPRSPTASSGVMCLCTQWRSLFPGKPRGSYFCCFKTAGMSPRCPGSWNLVWWGVAGGKGRRRMVGGGCGLSVSPAGDGWQRGRLESRYAPQRPGGQCGEIVRIGKN